MSQADFKHTLRKLEFPACAMEALPRIEAIIVSRSKQNFAMQLISEFVFLERSKDASESRKGQQLANIQMNAFQEFQLIIVFIEFFSQPGPDLTRNAVFFALFGTNQTPQRSKILCRLISTAVSGSVAPLLSAAGTWMQQVGCTNQPSLELAQSLVSDFIIYSRKTTEQLKQLPMVAPLFAANLMTAVADLYMNDQRGSLTPPPDALLDVFTEWISENTALCFASLQSPVLPGAAIAMPVVTPLAGLIRWVVLAPLVSSRLSYSNLHLWLLKTTLQVPKTGSTAALNAQHLGLIVGPLKMHVTRLKVDKADPTQDVAYMKCVERLAQAIQVAMNCNCIYGNIPQLFSLLETLPTHPLLSIVITTNKIKV